MFLAHKPVLTFRRYEKMDGNVGWDKIWAKVQLTINNTSLSFENCEFTYGFKWIFPHAYGISENLFIKYMIKRAIKFILFIVLQ